MDPTNQYIIALDRIIHPEHQNIPDTKITNNIDQLAKTIIDGLSNGSIRNSGNKWLEIKELNSTVKESGWASVIRAVKKFFYGKNYHYTAFDVRDKLESELKQRKLLFNVPEAISSIVKEEIKKVDHSVAFFSAVTEGNVAAVQAFIEAGVDVNDLRDINGDTALIFAALHKHTDILKALVEAGANLDMQGENGNTALLRAADKNDNEAIRVLIKAKANIDPVNKFRITPLTYCALHGNLEGVKALVEAWAELEIQTARGNTALSLAVLGGHTEIVELLLNAGARDQKALKYAVQKGFTETIRSLIKAGIDPNAQSQNGDTALIFAARHKHTELLKALVEAGANLDIQGENGNTALTWAAYKNDNEAIRVLIQAKANIDPVNKWKGSPLSYCALYGNLEGVKALIDAGADLDIQIKKGYTALSLAASWGEMEVVKLLIKAGANIEIANGEGLTPRLVAEEITLEVATDREEYAKMEKMVEMLIQAELDPDKMEVRRQRHILAVNSRENRLNPLLPEVEVDKLLDNTHLGEGLIGNAALLFQESKFLQTVTDHPQLPLDGSSIQSLLAGHLNAATIEFIETQSLKRAPQEVDYSLDTLLVILNELHKFQFDSLAQRCDDIIVERLTELQGDEDPQINEIARNIFELADSLNRWKLRNACIPFLSTKERPVVVFESSPSSQFNLFNKDRNEPRQIATDMLLSFKVGDSLSSDGESLGLHTICICNKVNRLEKVCQLYTKDEFMPFVQLLYTGEIDPSLNEEQLLQLINIGKKTDLHVSLKAVLGTAYLNQVLERTNQEDANKLDDALSSLAPFTVGKIDLDKYPEITNEQFSVIVKHLDPQFMPKLHITYCDNLTELRDFNLKFFKQIQKIGLTGSIEVDHTEAIFSALESGDIDLIRLFIDAGIDVANLRREDGTTPLMIAAENGFTQLAQLFITPENLNDVNAEGDTPLLLAARYHHTDVLKVLIQAGANLDVKNKDGITALYTAAYQNRIEMVETLLQAGANPDILTKGFSVIYAAAEKGYTEIVKKLIEAGANLNTQSKQGYTALHIAAKKGYSEIVKALLQVGVNTQIVTKTGKTPLQIAVENGHMAIVNAISGAMMDPEVMKARREQHALTIAKRNI